MTIGGGIALIVIGAILTYAVEFDISGLDIGVIGVILMIGGIVGLIFGLIQLGTSRRRVVAETYPSQTVVEQPVERVVERPVRRTEY